MTPAPALYAQALGNPCSGPVPCHWCGAPCERRWLHDEPLRMPHRTSTAAAKVPSSGWVCRGCWFFRLRRVTVRFADGTFADNKAPADFGWLITPDDAVAVRPQDAAALWRTLRHPPLTFCLMLKSSTPTWLHLGKVNDHAEIRKETELTFHLDNKPLRYTAYELEEAIATGLADGKEPGVRALLDYFGRPPQDPAPAAKREGGRPSKAESPPPSAMELKKVVRKGE